MSKRTVFTTITPLPQGATREVVLDFLHNHLEMIDLNPLVKERHPIKPPAHASPEEFHCIWYSLTDKISYLPGGFATSDISYTCAFHDLPNGLQTHCYAPMGLEIRDKWTLGGSLPGEPVQPVELGIGAPITGLYIREDVDMRCNIFMTGFVKKNLKKSHAVLVDRLKVKAQIAAAANLNHSMSIRNSVNSASSQGGVQQQAISSPDPNQYPTRPASSATTGSNHSAFRPPPPSSLSPGPTGSDFSGAGASQQQPHSPPPYGTAQSGYSQGPVTWQALKPQLTVNHHQGSPAQGRTASWGPQQMSHPQSQQYSSRASSPYAPAPLQTSAHGHQGQQQYYGQPPQHLGGGEQSGQYQYNQYSHQAPPLPSKDGQQQPHLASQEPRVPEDTKHSQNKRSSLNGPFIAELE